MFYFSYTDSSVEALKLTVVPGFGVSDKDLDKPVEMVHRERTYV